MLQRPMDADQVRELVDIVIDDTPTARKARITADDAAERQLLAADFGYYAAADPGDGLARLDAMHARIRRAARGGKR